jgi:hypothetical protein
MRLLDLFCGEGLAAWGYWLSGRFSEIVGVDINPEMSSSYSFDFVCADALTLDYEFLLQFDFIHASPPCQGYSKMTPDQSKHPRLIPGTHLMCALTSSLKTWKAVVKTCARIYGSMVMTWVCLSRVPATFTLAPGELLR